jgi:hypothetical protein
MERHEFDRRGLIRESYRIEGITGAQCRSIFLDWALGAGDTPPARDQIAALLAHFGTEEDHPMTRVLREGLEEYSRPAKRRGGRKGRVGG